MGNISFLLLPRCLVKCITSYDGLQKTFENYGEISYLTSSGFKLQVVDTLSISDKSLKTITELDEKIINLLNKRAEAEIKLLEACRPSAEEGYIEKLTVAYKKIKDLSPGPLPEAALKAIYREILSAIFSLLRPNTVAYLGPPATFAHMASLQAFGSSSMHVAVGSIAQVFEEVERGRADYGVVPVENSTEGTVTYTVDMFVDSSLKICGEILLQITQNLLSRASRLKDIKKVYSHPQALAQCRFWLENNLKGIELMDVESTAKAAQLASEEPCAAAVASEAAASIYGLNILGSSIQDTHNNYTRFFIIGKHQTRLSGRDKTSILFSVKHEVGALAKALKVLADNGLNLTQIDSRPSKKKAWEYIFFADFQGHLEQQHVSKALKQLEEACLFVKVLGSYPRSE